MRGAAPALRVTTRQPDEREGCVTEQQDRTCKRVALVVQASGRYVGNNAGILCHGHCDLLKWHGPLTEARRDISSSSAL
jgi:hypothetical protein